MPGAARMRVLLVDDEPALGRSVQALLAPDVDVVHATRGSEALARLDAGERYDIVLCDLMMPQMTGIEVFFELRAKHPALARKVIFLTGGAFTDQAREFLSRTEHPPLDKPFTEATLRAALERLTSPASRA
jgi:CheY-like chemotaxis protein